MGLDITAYRKLKPAENVELDEDGNPVDYDNYFRPGAGMDWSEGAFPGRGEGIDSDTTYSFEKRHGFRAGSYGGYSEWRNQLARLAGWDSNNDRYNKDPSEFEGKPFFELIWFADNEGVIGPIVSAKLLKDFKAYLPAAEQQDDWFLDRYRDWMNAFEMAADGGAVDFH